MNRHANGEPIPIPATTRPCGVCTKSFTPTPAQARVGFGKYCSRVCAGAARRKTDDFEYPTRMSWYLSIGWQQLSKRLREEAGTCSCGATEKLMVHHLRDPFPTRDRALAIDVTNLVVVCADCHNKNHRPGTKVACERCTKPFVVSPSRAKRRRYCSQECYRPS